MDLCMGYHLTNVITFFKEVTKKVNADVDADADGLLLHIHHSES